MFRPEDTLSQLELTWHAWKRGDGTRFFKVELTGSVDIETLRQLAIGTRTTLPEWVYKELWLSRGYDETGTWLVDPEDPEFKVSPGWVALSGEQEGLHTVIPGRDQPEMRMTKQQVATLLVKKHGRCTIKALEPYCEE